MMSEQKQSNGDQNNGQIKEISFFQLLRFATKSDKVMMIIGSIFAIANGMSMPMFAYIFGNMTDAFKPNATADDVLKSASEQAIWFCVLGACTFFACWIQMATWMISGERQAIRYRKEYFKAILNQEIGWFDQQNPNELATKVATESFAIQGAIGEKVPTYIMTLAMCFGGFIIGYLRGWQLSLVVTAVLPAIALSMVLFMFFSKSSQKETSDSYSKAGGQAEQAINAIKTVKSLNGEEYELKNYSTSLVQAWKIAVKNGLYLGFGLGVLFCCIFCDYSLGFWYGSKLIEEKKYSVGDVITVFYSVIIGGFSMGQSAPCVKAFAQGKEAAKKVFAVLDRKPLIDLNLKGVVLKNQEFVGRFDFKNVNFCYPSKPDQLVLNNLNVVFEANKKTALVGESGSGKSTIVQLLERFYDVSSGVLELDGINLKDINLKWLRENIGYVGQEPVLFATTIRENLKYGKEDATEEEMIGALIQANAWNFVKNLKKKLDTFVGQGGGQFSGGQKQRLCIARAILKNPKILFLDEATSALDRKNEKKIQETLDQVSKGRTTIVIAHRISTIMNADKIIVLDKGIAIESGSHQDLINNGGKYEALAKNQMQLENKDQNNKFDKNQQEQLDRPIISETNELKEIAININKEDDEIVEEIDPLVLKKQNEEQEQKKKKEEEKKLIEKKNNEGIVMKRLFSYNKRQKLIFSIGSLAALINGLCFPLLAYILSNMITTLSIDLSPAAYDQNIDRFRSERDKFALGFFLVAIGGLFCNMCQTYFFTRVGESITLRLRVQIYEKILKMPVSWFDQPQNNPGSLVSRLSADAALVNQLASNVVGLQLQNLSSFISGIIIAFYASWEISLVTLGVSPLLVISGQIAMKFVTGFSAQTDEGYKDSGNLVMEAVTNIRTVSSFGNQNVLMKMMEEKLEAPSQIITKKGQFAGISLGFSQGVMFGIFALIFYLGAVFHKYNGLDPLDMFTALFAIMFSSQASGNNNHFMVDVGQAKNAGINLFQILDSKDELDLQKERKSPNLQIPIEGNILFKNVQFKYPTRDKIVFENLNLKIDMNQKVAFVGPSGCGKSTIIQLLMRFYDCENGQILIDGRDIQDYDIKYLRQQFGVVTQEPVLFNASIKENILYNSQKNDQEIRLAAQQANALQFIENDDFINSSDKDGKGFDRQVGPKGSQISGGQKQRIAIARAILKNPKILLFDEATSALDSQNEYIVQESLNQIMKEKTSLSIAHRISTIMNSDIIFVIENGNLVEQGKYQELVQKQGFFYRLEKGDN